MSELASIYTGRPVAVDVVDMPAQVGGEAWYRGCKRIPLSSSLTGPYVAEVLFHEIGHHVCGHISDKTSPPRDFSAPSHITLRGYTPNMNGSWEERTKAIFDRFEEEANAWAAKHLAELRQRFGDIDRLLCG